MTYYLLKMKQELADTMEKLSVLIESLFIYLEAREEAQQDDSVCSKEQEMKYHNVEIRPRGGDKYYKWYARVPLGKKVDKYNYKYIYGRNRTDCYNKLKDYLDGAQYKIDVKKIKKLESPKRTMTFLNFYPIYIDGYRRPYIKGSTLRTCENIWKNWIKDTFGKKKIADVEKTDVLTFLSSIGYDQQRHRVRLWLSHFFSSAVTHGIIKSSPMANLKLPKPKGVEEETLTTREDQCFVQRAKQSDYWLAFALMLYEGLRPGEAKALRKCDVKENCIEVCQALDDFCDVTSTKTGNVRRVPIFEQTKELLQRYVEDGSKDLIFDFDRKSKNTLNMEYRKIMQDVGLDRVMYTLRHTFATRCAEAGISPKQVQLWMGHSDVETTLTYYTHISTELEQANVLAKNKR